MNTNSPFFITLLLSGLSLLGGGWFLFKYPPKSINVIYGYRSKRSKSSQQLWDYSQPLAARMFMGCGVFLSLLSIIGCFVSFGETAEVCVALAVAIGTCFVMRTKMENMLAQRLA